MKKKKLDSCAQPQNKRCKYEKTKYLNYFPPHGTQPNASLYDAFCPYAPLQWWYGNAHLIVEGEEKSSLAFFASFFRQCTDNHPSENSAFYDACTWALIDNEKSKYYPDSLLDSRALDEVRKRIDPKITGRPTAHIEGALLENINQGHLPRPDRLMKGLSTYEENPLRINLGDESIFQVVESSDTYRRYRFTHHNPIRNISADLTFSTNKLPVLHGEDGVVNHMYYYYFPSMDVNGTVTINGERKNVKGMGWYDREFGGEHSDVGRDARDSWSWFSLHFSNRSQFSLFRVCDENGVEKELIGIFTTKEGERRCCNDVRFCVNNTWTSMITFISYPSTCTIEVPSIKLQCIVRPVFKAQEFVTMIVSGSGFFEGTVSGNGTLNGNSICVTGFHECKCPIQYSDTNGFMKTVGKFVNQTLSSLYPLSPSDEWIRLNVLGRHAAPKGNPSDKISEALFHPVRTIIDRGGKAWRSLVLVSCCNALSIEYFDCTRYIAMAELLHVGSLIIDDIQDNSLVRRGGNCVHIDCGVATAINAGTACYFMAPHLARIQDLPPEKSARIYQHYIDLMCAGHAGQGLDIIGLDYLMPELIATGDAQPLFDALRAIHIYKTGGAAGTICKMACILCEANPTVSNAMEYFGVQLGLAFQIVDDALNLKGFDGNLKEAAEDVKDGKITYPTAKAMEKLERDDREALWNILKTKPKKMKEIKEVLALINKTGAVNACLSEARIIIEESWRVLDPHLAPSLSKNIMHTFCTYLVERTY